MIGKLISNLGRAPAEPQAEAEEAAPGLPPGLPPELPPELPPFVGLLQRVVDALRDDLYVSNLLAAQTLLETTLAKPQFDDPKRLERAGFKAYSQNDEDGILQEIFRRIGAPHKSFVEFGCGNGMENNTSYLLQQGWRGLWMDGSDSNAQFIGEQFAHLIKHGLLKFESTFITRENIDGLIAAADLGAEIDLLSVDIDGNDYHVWEAVRCVSARVVVVEYNARLRPPNDWTLTYNAGHTWDSSDRFGASLSALTRLGKQLGYQLVTCNISGCNAFFVRKDLCGELFATPATAEHLYHPPRPFFTPYFLAGPKPGAMTIVEGAAQRAGLPWPPA